MKHETDAERRAILRTITAASSAALTSAILPRSAAAQPIAKSFERAEVKVGDNTIFVRRYGEFRVLRSVQTRHPNVVSGLREVDYHALRNEDAVRLIKDHFIDGRPPATKFDEKAVEFDNTKPSPLLGREARPVGNRASA